MFVCLFPSFYFVLFVFFLFNFLNFIKTETQINFSLSSFTARFIYSTGQHLYLGGHSTFSLTQQYKNTFSFFFFYQPFYYSVHRFFFLSPSNLTILRTIVWKIPGNRWFAKSTLGKSLAISHLLLIGYWLACRGR